LFVFLFYGNLFWLAAGLSGPASNKSPGLCLCLAGGEKVKRKGAKVSRKIPQNGIERKIHRRRKE